MIDTQFELNGHAYTVWAEYGFDAFEGQTLWQCRRQDGNGTIYLLTSDVEAAIQASTFAEPESITHLGGSPASAGCKSILPQDVFSHRRNSVDCTRCLEATQRVIKHGQRYQVDYDENRRSWGVVDTFSDTPDLFVAHTTTPAGARIQRRRLAQQRYAWTQ